MPDLIAEALGAVGEELADWLELTPLDPAYRAHYPDGSTLDVHTDTDPDGRRDRRGSAAPGGRRLPAASSTTPGELSAWRRADFIDRNLDAPADLLTGTC